ncbi:protein FAM50, partial [Tremellales sp. Uapishka_1]
MSGPPEESRRQLVLAKQREREAAEHQRQKDALIKDTQMDRTVDRFIGVTENLDERLKKSTIGLVTLSDFQKTKEDLEEQQRRLAAQSAADKSGSVPKIKRIKKKEKSKLSFAMDEEEEALPEKRMREEDAGGKKKFAKNPGVDTSFLPDREREEREQFEREELRKQWLDQQEVIKTEDIEIVYSYWDGSGHRKSVEEDLIIPHHYTFYDFILNKARGKSGPLFNFDVHDDVRLLQDATKEKDEVRMLRAQCVACSRTNSLTQAKSLNGHGITVQNISFRRPDGRYMTLTRIMDPTFRMTTTTTPTVTSTVTITGRTITATATTTSTSTTTTYTQLTNTVTSGTVTVTTTSTENDGYLILSPTSTPYFTATESQTVTATSTTTSTVSAISTQFERRSGPAFSEKRAVIAAKPPCPSVWSSFAAADKSAACSCVLSGRLPTATTVYTATSTVKVVSTGPQTPVTASATTTVTSSTTTTATVVSNTIATSTQTVTASSYDGTTTSTATASPAFTAFTTVGATATVTTTSTAFATVTEHTTIIQISYVPATSTVTSTYTSYQATLQGYANPVATTTTATTTTTQTVTATTTVSSTKSCASTLVPDANNFGSYSWKPNQGPDKTAYVFINNPGSVAKFEPNGGTYTLTNHNTAPICAGSTFYIQFDTVCSDNNAAGTLTTSFSYGGNTYTNTPSYCSTTSRTNSFDITINSDVAVGGLSFAFAASGPSDDDLFITLSNLSVNLQ